MLYFENDYCEGAHPAILQKLTETNFEKVSSTRKIWLVGESIKKR